MDEGSRNRSTGYDEDVVAWATEQARLIRARAFDRLDIEHIADEIEDVGRSERRELASRMAVLLVHLIKWQFQPARRGASGRATITHQRQRIALALDETPSLKVALREPRWLQAAWLDSLGQAARETRRSAARFPDNCPWTTEQILDADFWPSAQTGPETLNDA